MTLGRLRSQWARTLADGLTLRQLGCICMLCKKPPTRVRTWNVETAMAIEIVAQCHGQVERVRLEQEQMEDPLTFGDVIRQALRFFRQNWAAYRAPVKYGPAPVFAVTAVSGAFRYGRVA